MGAALLAAAPALRAAPGDIDPSFNTPPGLTSFGPWKAVLAGNQYYLVNLVGLLNGWGGYQFVHWDVPGDYLTRWNADGARDTTFTAATLRGSPPREYHGTFSGGTFNAVRDFLINREGRLLVAGYFRSGAAFRFPIDPSGNGYPALPSSATDSGSLNSVIALKEGGALLNGFFSTAGFNEPQPHLIRLNSDYSVDRGFVPDKDRDPLGDYTSDALAVLSDSRILVRFYSIADRTAKLRCLNPDGTYDSSFNERLLNELFTIPAALQLPDGKILLGDRDLVQLRSDGAHDPDFTPPAFEHTTCMALQADGKILVGRGYVFGAEYPALRRLNADGSEDTAFKALDGPDGLSISQLSHISLMPDGRVLVGGVIIKSIDGSWTQNFAMLKNDPAVSVLEKADTTMLRWRRGGSAPEVWRVTFEHRAAGAEVWTPLGEGARVSGGWELAVPGGLPIEGRIRARGWHPGHPNNSGWVEATLSLGAPLSDWRLSHFGSADNAGSGADGADSDGDGLPNLTEYVFGSDPESPSASPLPAWTVSGDSLECHFDIAPGLSPFGITAEWATHPASSSWQTVEGQADGTARSFKIPVSGRQRIFVRFRISAPQ